METDIGDRIRGIMDDNNLNYRSLSSIVGYSDVAVGKIVKGETKPNYEFLLTLISKFPEVNINWLITGIGEMKANNNRLGVPPPNEIDLEDLLQFKVEFAEEVEKKLAPYLRDLEGVLSQLVLDNHRMKMEISKLIKQE